MNFERRIRQIEKQTGCAISISGQWTESGKLITATDPDLDRTFTVSIRLASQAERALRKLHEDVYHARAQQVYLNQERKCAICGDKMSTYETDHIKRRSKGRDDRMTNLRCVHTTCHRQRHGG